MHDFITLSWNLEKVGPDKSAEIAPQVAKTVGGAVDLYSEGEKVPFLGFFLEIKGGPEAEDTVQDMCDTFQREFNKSGSGLEGTSFDKIYCGGESHTREWIIVFARGMNVTGDTFDFRSAMKPYVDQDVTNAQTKFDSYTSMSNSRRKGLPRQFTSNRPENQDYEYQFKPEKTLVGQKGNYREADHNVGWYRNGVVCSIESTDGGKPIRVASLHAPGPDLTNRYDAVINALKDAAEDAGVDIMTGDFNTTKTLQDDTFEDITSHWPSDVGSTLKKQSTTDLGTHRWDRILKTGTSPFEGRSHGPIVADSLQGLSDKFDRVTDHALLAARFKRVERQEDQFEPPFGFQSQSPLRKSSFDDRECFDNFEKAQNKLSEYYNDNATSRDIYMNSPYFFGEGNDRFNPSFMDNTFNQSQLRPSQSGNLFNQGEPDTALQEGMNSNFQDNFQDPDSFLATSNSGIDEEGPNALNAGQQQTGIDEEQPLLQVE